MNRVLTDAARKRSERIEELELQLAQLRQVVTEREQEAAGSAAISNSQADMINQLNVELSAIREAAADRAIRINEMNDELAIVREAAKKSAEIESQLADLRQ